MTAVLGAEGLLLVDLATGAGLLAEADERVELLIDTLLMACSVLSCLGSVISSSLKI